MIKEKKLSAESGLGCPYCGSANSLKVKWTRNKGRELRRYCFQCAVCGEPVTGWLTLDIPAPNSLPEGKGHSCSL